jgi:hypothetical protein
MTTPDATAGIPAPGFRLPASTRLGVVEWTVVVPSAAEVGTAAASLAIVSAAVERGVHDAELARGAALAMRG